MNQISSFLTILNKHRENATSERNKGDRFENLIQAYLQTDPKYTFEVERVWLADQIYADVKVEKFANEALKVAEKNINRN